MLATKTNVEKRELIRDMETSVVKMLNGITRTVNFRIPPPQTSTPCLGEFIDK
jgi:hypothetical protein